jgi:glycosyltransferase involved in cell wall biosynthesis
MFAYWGTRGALCEFSRSFARVMAAQSDIRCTFSISSSNELLPEYSFLNGDLFAVDTFRQKLQAFTHLGGIYGLRSRLRERLANDNTRAFVSFMPHIWSPFAATVIRRAGVRHIAVIHDADPHPGDRSSWLNWWLLNEATVADRVITLSEWVAQRLVARGVPRDKISVLFHPDLNHGCDCDAHDSSDGPLRVLFLGRILAYKGLDLFIDAAERLIGDGVALKVGVFGQGKITEANLWRLSAIGAEVENRWLQNDEFKSVLSRHDVVVASHTEASQSGVIASAFGAGLPVVAVPIGGLVEQIRPNVTGVIAESATAHSLVLAIRKLAEDRAFLTQLRNGIAATRQERSMQRFFDDVCAIALGSGDSKLH